MSAPLRWGILSTGRIAGIFAHAVRRSRTGRLAAVGSRDVRSARVFAKEHRVPRAYGDYPSLLKDPQVEAVYIAPPHPFHLRWTLEALRAGKHVLCEKPLAMGAADARRMVQAARKNRRFLMEAFMYRCHPQTRELVRLVRDGAIGKVRFIQASFCFDAPLDLKNRLFNKKLGGGGILDVGCYPVSMARLLAGAAQGKAFAEPVELKGTGILGEKSGVDEMASAILRFPGDILAELSCAIRADRGESMVRVDGTKGSLTVPSPWFAKWEGGTSYLLHQPQGAQKPRRIPVRCQKGLYTVEADEVARSIRQGLFQSPAMSWEDSLGNARVLDAWRRSVGLP
ncbi:MAG TPA: Gfo/Idh/MocA family oxidoreductase [bacterium]|nr:Gfo/Idh/MocA family oxidoreductase [bacterium]